MLTLDRVFLLLFLFLAKQIVVITLFFNVNVIQYIFIVHLYKLTAL